MDEQDVAHFEVLRGMLHCACGRRMEVACTTIYIGVEGEQRIWTHYRCWACQARELGGRLIGGWVGELAQAS